MLKLPPPYLPNYTCLLPYLAFLYLHMNLFFCVFVFIGLSLTHSINVYRYHQISTYSYTGVSSTHLPSYVTPYLPEDLPINLTSLVTEQNMRPQGDCKPTYLLQTYLPLHLHHFTT